MKTTKKVRKKSKNVLGRKPQSTFHVRELMKEEEYAGGPKKLIERVYAVDNFCSS